LYPVGLDYLGLVGAARCFCRDFGEQNKVIVVFSTHDMPSHVQADTSLYLVRVLQQGLGNTLKHTGAKQFDVHLWGMGDEVHLTISDAGTGFEPNVARTGFGLGMISMWERVQVVNGRLSVELRSKFGTTIHAHVPLT
jgi:signal transduction histidine kinase